MTDRLRLKRRDLCGQKVSIEKTAWSILACTRMQLQELHLLLQGLYLSLQGRLQDQRDYQRQKPKFHPLFMLPNSELRQQRNCARLKEIWRMLKRKPPPSSMSQPNKFLVVTLKLRMTRLWICFDLGWLLLRELLIRPGAEVQLWMLPAEIFSPIVLKILTCEIVAAPSWLTKQHAWLLVQYAFSVTSPWICYLTLHSVFSNNIKVVVLLVVGCLFCR